MLFERIQQLTCQNHLTAVALHNHLGGSISPAKVAHFLTAIDNVQPNYAADLVVLLASGRADTLSGRFFTIKDDVVGLVQRESDEGLGDLQTLRLIQPS